MNPDWKAFLESHSAQFDDNNLARFNDTAELPDCALFDLSYLGMMKLEGEESEEFMQGQFTNDTREINTEQSQLSGYCSPKGRMLALLRISKRDDAYLLQLPAPVQANVQKRLQMFVLRSKVTITDDSDNRVCIGLSGNCTEELIQQLVGSIPENSDDTVHNNGVSCIRMHGDTPRFQLIVASDQAPALWEQLTAKATPANTELWKLLAIQAGEPAVYPETVEAFVPQMANMQLVNGVSFKKGCYTGQEVVARMQYLGKLKRRMYRAQVDSAVAPAPGDELVAGESSSGQGTGRIVEAAPSPKGGFEALAVVEISSRESDEVHLGEIDGPKLQFLELPYTFETKDE